MPNLTKIAKNLKEGNRIVLSDEQIGVVDFVYKCHDQVHILVKIGEATEMRSFLKTDTVSFNP